MRAKLFVFVTVVYSLVMMLVVDVQAALKQPPILQALTDELDFIDDLNLNLIRAKDKFFVRLKNEGTVFGVKMSDGSALFDNHRNVKAMLVEKSETTSPLSQKEYIDNDTKRCILVTSADGDTILSTTKEFIVFHRTDMYTTVNDDIYQASMESVVDFIRFRFEAPVFVSFFRYY